MITKGTASTLVAWGVLIAIRLPFAFASHAAKYPQGLVIGELLLALAMTFAAQNAVIWQRSPRRCWRRAGVGRRPFPRGCYSCGSPSASWATLAR